MFKIFSASLIIAAACVFATAQGPASRDKNEPPSLGVAPKIENGVGRADVRVFARPAILSETPPSTRINAQRRIFLRELGRHKRSRHDRSAANSHGQPEAEK